MIYSGWIENLGVVPLLLFAAFLFLPDLHFFLFLLFLVTLVFETMMRLLKSLRFSNLRFLRLSVKSFFIIGYCLSNAALAARPLLIPRSGIKELKIENLKQFSIGDKSVISAKYLKKRGILLIKGKKKGRSTLIFYQNNRMESKALEILVVHKSQHQGLKRAKAKLEGQGLKVELGASGLKVLGEIESVEQLISLLKHKKKIQVFPTWRPQFKAEFLKRLYQKILLGPGQEALCQIQGAQVECFYNEQFPLYRKQMRKLTALYGIQFTPIIPSPDDYQVEFKIVKRLHRDQSQMNLGGSHLDGVVGDYFGGRIKNSLYKNKWGFKNQNLEVKNIATPKILTQLDYPTLIKVGAEIPYDSFSEKSGNQKSWKFAGLKIEFTLQAEKGHLLMKMHTVFTQPTGQNISGSEKKTKVFIALERPKQVFTILYQTEGTSLDRLPYLGAIPLLGKLFQSKGQAKQTQELIVITTVTKKLNDSNE